MPMIRKIISLLALISLAKILIGCMLISEGPCSDNPFHAYKHHSLSVFNLNNSGGQPAVANADVPKQAYGIRLAFTLEKIASKTLEGQMFSRCYADCGYDPILHPADSIVSIAIVSNNEFDIDHHLGSDVSEYFRYLNYNKYLTIQELLKENENPDDLIKDYNFSSNQRTIDLLLLTPPQYASPFTFEVTVKLSNGIIMKETTSSINLK
jgi:hypothetical protein